MKDKRMVDMKDHLNINQRAYPPDAFKGMGKFQPTLRQRIKLKLKKLRCGFFGHKLKGTDDWVYSRCDRCGYLHNHYEVGGTYK